MNAIALSMKKQLKTAFQRAGLYDTALDIRRMFDPESRKDRDTKRYQTVLQGIPVQFSAEGKYSNAYFFPRYADGRLHEKNVTEMLVDALRGASCFVDVGTNLGWYTCIAATQMPRGTVYGFEMDDLNYELLCRNSQLNGCRNAELFHLAVSDRPGVVTYERRGTRPSSFFRLQTEGSRSRSSRLVSVQSAALDDLFFDGAKVPPDVMKIDVEGAEMSVLRGMQRILREFRPKLFLEVHPAVLHQFGSSTPEILAFLMDHDYSVCEIQDIREQETAPRLKRLDYGAVIEKNNMLYAVPVNQA